MHISYIVTLKISSRKAIFRELIELLEMERKRLLEALPHQFVVSNIILCVIKMICEENGQSNAAFGDLVPHDSLDVRFWILKAYMHFSYSKRNENFLCSGIWYCHIVGALENPRLQKKHEPTRTSKICACCSHWICDWNWHLYRRYLCSGKSFSL